MTVDGDIVSVAGCEGEEDTHQWVYRVGSVVQGGRVQ